MTFINVQLLSTVTLAAVLSACSGSNGSADPSESKHTGSTGNISMGGSATATATASSTGGTTAAAGGAVSGTLQGGTPAATITIANGGSTRATAAGASSRTSQNPSSTSGGSAGRGGASGSANSSINQGGSVASGGVIGRGGSNSAALGGVGGGASVSTPSGIDCRKEGDNKTTLVFVNGCSQTVSYRGSDIAGGSIAPGAFACVDLGTTTEAISSKRYWGWVGTDPGAGRYTLAEFTFNTDFYDLDWYNISHVDAHNLPMAILPAARPKCRQLNCPEDFLAACPTVGQYHDAAGNLVSCVNPGRDDPNNPVSLLFEQCDDAYAWSGDDQKGSDPSPMIGCEVEDFDVVFCPGAP